MTTTMMMMMRASSTNPISPNSDGTCMAPTSSSTIPAAPATSIEDRKANAGGVAGGRKGRGLLAQAACGAMIPSLAFAGVSQGTSFSALLTPLLTNPW